MTAHRTRGILAAAGGIALALAAAGAQAPRPATAPEPLPFPRRSAVVAVVETAGPAVISIHAERRAGVDLDWLFREFFEPPRFRRSEVQGSGVIIHPAGYAITNYHVVHGADRIEVAVEGRRCSAEVVAIAPEDDLAILKVEGGEPFPVVRVGRSDDLMVGETVICLGSPFGLEKSVTTGVICATDRSVTLPSGRATFKDFIQTDAAVNPGNSGGPLLNVRGELVGINTAILNQGWGISFAIPVDRVKAKLRQLANQELWLGIEYRALPGIAGVQIARVLPDGPAARAGLEKGDVIRSVNGMQIESVFDLTNALLGTGFDRRVTVAVDGRKGRRRAVIAAVSGADQVIWERLGLAATEVGLRRGSDYRAGLRIDRLDPGGPAVEVSLRKGDCIVAVVPGSVRWGAEVPTPETSALARVLGALEPGDRLGIRILRGGMLYEGRCVVRGKGSAR